MIFAYSMSCLSILFIICSCLFCFFFFKQKTAYEMRISDWSSDVCSSDLVAKQMAERFPDPFKKAAHRAEEYARGLLTGGTLFEELGFYYIGPVDGHNLSHLLPVLRNVRASSATRPVLVHVVTQKGKGYAPAEASEIGRAHV